MLARPLAVAAGPAPTEPLDAAQLRMALRKLQVTGSVLYIGAHPDDDNTSVLATLSRGRLMRTAYLSLTRGDGGQNILGSEAGDALGVIRTQELLASRQVDGAQQYFTRALDFGFSKSPDEALAYWGHDRVLADVVWVIRRFRPDVMVTRFGTDGSGGHGHHTASAILAGEAFRAAADPARFPEQLRWVTPWQAKRLLWNTWNPKLEGRDPQRPPIVTLDVGAYDPELGASYSEIGGRARSLNRSQGAGTPERRGSLIEYFEPVDGEPAARDLFDGVDVGWSRVAEAQGVAAALREAEKGFDADRPESVLPELARAHAALSALPVDPLVAAKRRDLESVMSSCAGLRLEALAETPTVTPGDTLTVTITALNRSAAPLTLMDIALPGGAHANFAKPAAPRASGPPSGAAREMVADPAAPVGATPRALPANQPVVSIARVIIPAHPEFTEPYWLTARALSDSSQIPDSVAAGDPEGRPAALAQMTVGFGAERVTYEVPVAFRWTDRVYGDRYRALEVLPPATCELDEGAYLFASATPRRVRVAVHSTRAALGGTARLRLPPGWKSDPATAQVAVNAGGEQLVSFQVTPRDTPASAVITAEVEVAGDRYTRRLVRIDYPHLPIQTMLPAASAFALRTDLRRNGDTIGYLMGSGDQVAEALRQMGFTVVLLTDDDVENGNLARFSAIVAGVRAYNTRPRLRVLQPRLLDYVKNGGRLVVQYNTNESALDDRLGPWPFKISRDRVTDERATMRVLRPAHPLLNSPNRIVPGDFAGWVQERGLNYAGPWDARYETVLSANDAGESAKDGGLLYARYGRGVFIYTGLAFFRQLPAGVPGAWRLFANLVSATK
jgi:LmbE family N-acetylglucosaminyl deacetylase